MPQPRNSLLREFGRWKWEERMGEERGIEEETGVWGFGENRTSMEISRGGARECRVKRVGCV